MRRSSLFVAVLHRGSACGRWSPTPRRPTEPQNRVDVIKVEGAIDRPLMGYLDQHLEQAVADRAVIVLQVDSAGTIGQDGVALAQRLVELPVPVLVWVGPVPARASGAGMLLMDAASLAAVAPGSQTGPRDPIDLLAPDDGAARSGRDDPGMVGRPRSPCRSRPPERGDARRRCRAVRVRRSRRHVGRRPAEQGGRAHRADGRGAVGPAHEGRHHRRGRERRDRCGRSTSSSRASWSVSPTRSRPRRWSISCWCSGWRASRSRSRSPDSGSRASRGCS